MDKDIMPFVVAQLIDHFHLTPDEIGTLTRFQVFNLYMWPRDEHGGLVAPNATDKPLSPPVDPIEVLKALKKQFPHKSEEIDAKINALRNAK